MQTTDPELALRSACLVAKIEFHKLGDGLYRLGRRGTGHIVTVSVHTDGYVVRYQPHGCRWRTIGRWKRARTALARAAQWL